MTDIMYNFRIGKSTLSIVILKCCNVLWDVLNNEILLIPNEEKWKKLAKDFEIKWQLPHCVSALDGKHVVHEAFANSGSTNFNYKGSHSTILLAMCDANYNFISVNIGMPDDPLLQNLMRPYPGRGTSKLPVKQAIFNYRLSRARRCIENCFGILVSKWRIYKTVIIASEQTVVGIVKATVVLHNFIKNEETEAGLNSYCSLENMEGENENRLAGLVPVGQLGSNFYDRNAKEIRLSLTEYLAGEGAVPFQYLNI